MPDPEFRVTPKEQAELIRRVRRRDRARLELDGLEVDMRRLVDDLATKHEVPWLFYTLDATTGKFSKAEGPIAETLQGQKGKR